MPKINTEQNYSKCTKKLSKALQYLFQTNKLLMLY